jgi:hypothetical protein
MIMTPRIFSDPHQYWFGHSLAVRLRQICVLRFAWEILFSRQLNEGMNVYTIIRSAEELLLQKPLHKVEAMVAHAAIYQANKLDKPQESEFKELYWLHFQKSHPGAKRYQFFGDPRVYEMLIEEEKWEKAFQKKLLADLQGAPDVPEEKVEATMKELEDEARAHNKAKNEGFMSDLIARWLKEHPLAYAVGKTPEQLEDTLSIFIESTFTMCLQLRYLNNFEQLYHIVTQYIRCVTGKPIMKGFTQIFDILKTMFNEIKEEAIAFMQSGDEEDSPKNPFSSFRKWFTMCDSLSSHPMIKKIKKIFHYILSYSLFERFGLTFDNFWFSKAEEEYTKKQCDSKNGFVYAVVDGASFILERLYDCITTGSWNPIIHSGHQYGVWVDSVYQIKEDSQKLQNPDVCGFSYHEFLMRLDAALERGEAICKYATDIDKGTFTMLKRLQSELRLLKASECTKRAARENRPMPFSLLHYGGSSVAKTTLQKVVFYYIARISNQSCDSSCHYTRCFADDFWSGFRTYMWSIVLDDVAAQNPNMGPDASMAEIIQILNMIPTVTNQADLEDKGCIPLRPLLVQTTTNTKSLNAGAYYCNQLAILRRFPLVITVVVKAEYCTLINGQVPIPAERMLDHSRVPKYGSEDYPDFWELKVEKIIAHADPVTGIQTAKYIDALPGGAKFTSIYEFLAYVGKEYIAHHEHQRDIEKAERLYSEILICKTCFFPKNRCHCSPDPSLLPSPVSEDKMEVQYVDDEPGLSPGDRIPHFDEPEETKDADTEPAPILQSAEYPVMPVIIGMGLMLTVQFAWRKWKHRLFDAAAEYIQVFAWWILGKMWNSLWSKAAEVPQMIAEVPQVIADEVTDTLSTIRTNVAQAGVSYVDRLKMECNKVKALAVEYGDKVRQVRVKHKWLTIFLGMVPVLLMGVAAWRMMKDPFLQGSTDEGVRIVTQDDKPNPWYQEESHPAVFSSGRLTNSWKPLPEHSRKKVLGNCLHVAVRYVREGKPKIRPIKVFCVGGQLYVTNNHNIPECDVMLSCTSSPLQTGISQNYDMKLFHDDVFRLPEKDLIFFRMNCVPPKLDLMELLPREGFATVCNGTMCMRDKTGQEAFQNLRAIKPLNGRYVQELDATFDGWQAVGERLTQSGECGAVILGDTPSGPVILGLHQAGGRTVSQYSVHLSKESCLKAVVHFRTPIISAGPPNLTDREGVPIQLEPLHHKSTFKYLETGNASVYGSLPGFRPAHKSKVTKTAICDAVLQRGYTVDTAPPLMKGWKPWRLAAQDIVDQNFNVHQSSVDKCVDAFANDIISRLSKEDLDEIVVLDNETTLNGYPGTKYLDGMKRNTSAGFPFKQKKSKYLQYHGRVDVWDDFVQFEPVIMERVEEIISCYEKGQRWMPVFTGHLKDEPLKKSKVAEGKTRVFAGGPCDHGFVMRKYLLAFVRIVQKNKFIFESCPGTNTTSAEWDLMYHHLTVFGKDRMIAGDYSKFDKRMSAIFILAAFQVIDRVLVAAGWGFRDRLIVMCIGIDIAFPLTDFNGDLVMFWGSNPSGHPLTVIINGIVNSLYVRYAWLMAGNDLDLFILLVVLLTYGDDNTLGVHKSVTNFDHTVIAKNLATIGVVYTMADKEAESVPFIGIDQIAFLKRTWRYEPEVGSHVAKIDESSIAKMLTMQLPSDVVCREQHAIDVMHNALREYFFYGREIFEAKKVMFSEVINECDLAVFHTVDFPIFDELRAEYLTASAEYFPDSEGRCPDCSHS